MLAQTVDAKKAVYPTWSSPKQVDIKYQIEYERWLSEQPGGTTKNNSVKHMGCGCCPHGVLRHKTSHKTKETRCTHPGCLCMNLHYVTR